MLVPTLPALDLDESVAYYGSLGFEVVSRYPEHAYVILTRGEEELHLYLCDDPDIPENTSLYWRVADAEAFHAALVEARVAPPAPPPELKPWGQVEFALVDPSGCLIRVGSPAKRSPHAH